MIEVLCNILEKSKAQIESRTNQKLLDILEAAGVTLPYGCRAGSCGSCRVKVAQGKELLDAIGPMEQDTLDRCGDGGDVRLACRAKFHSENLSGKLHLEAAPELSNS